MAFEYFEEHELLARRARLAQQIALLDAALARLSAFRPEPAPFASLYDAIVAALRARPGLSRAQVIAWVGRAWPGSKPRSIDVALDTLRLEGVLRAEGPVLFVRERRRRPATIGQTMLSVLRARGPLPRWLLTQAVCAARPRTGGKSVRGTIDRMWRKGELLRLGRTHSYRYAIAEKTSGQRPAQGSFRSGA